MFDNAFNPVTSCDSLNPTPLYFLIIMTFIGVSGTFINLTTIFVVFHKTSKKMNNYKAILISYQILVSFNDIMMTLVVQPVLFSPLPFCIISGLGKYFDLPKRFWLTLMLSTFMASLANITGLFYYRLNIIIFNTGIHKIIRSILNRILLSFFVALPIILLGIFFQSSMPYEVVLQKYFELYNCTRILIDYDGFIMMDREFAAAASRSALIESFILVFLPASMAIITYIKISTNKNIFSLSTVRLQKKFQKTLICQIFLPLSVVLFPNVVFNFIGTYATISEQDIANMLVLLISSHGMFFNISVLLLNKEYSEYLKGRVNLLFELRSQISSSKHPPTLLKH